ncbi:amidase [Yoonia sediminilitoris]|uniref:Asp-tRNA(Asn)/Glu-tRNA(Gln) amidotransferase A subunit family amidase n=1 Tax=Yoonia sediminilitoris TaxID=1286148 RepID=A0A2T6KRG3_9RHOB|nr:amidase [Yoonia sediminilitoris]PUB19146.1 Asp-tRNA(Asn)/Glu-tRNA(Gln) amidotransferase A subunit family amidase [Yoonia sediminilitoris]RCW99314.1 Asp-tRNA(Asn)/Glu-tRNA(Gln) amidotransferase A subunit family amidase [Yoonia sediminilitoris]
MTETISEADIAGAERLLGLAYTARERAQMVGNLDGQRDLAIARRTLPLDNGTPMACRFDPRLPGFAMPHGVDALQLSEPSAPLPSDPEDIAFAPLTHLSQWVRRGQITSAALTELYLERIAALNPKLECFATVTPDLARAEAAAMDSLLQAGVWLGPLHGIPYGLKDLFDTKGIITGWGAEPFQDRVPDSDATVTTRLRAAGAVLIGKTTLGALAYNDLWYGGWTRNPWNLHEGSSGSSAGSASATAAGLCGFSIGTETLGSITSPSQRCGTTGLRPTFGRVSRAGAMALCWSLDKVGPICRSVEDTGLVLAALNGGDAADRGSIAAPFQFDATAGIDGMTLGYLPEAFEEGATDVDRAALAAARDLGITVKEVTIEDLPYASLMMTVYAEAAAAFEALTLEDTDDTLTWQDEGAWPNTFRKARFISAVDLVQTDRLRYRVMQAVAEMMSGVDALIGPFSTGPMLVASNFTGHPCLHIRAGFEDIASRTAASLGAGKLTTGEAAGEKTFTVPHGISLWGQLFDEGPLLNLGMALEQKLGVAERRPTFPT